MVVVAMQYFMALKMGEKRVRAAQELLTRYAGHAMPALALKDNKDNKWEPVGEETLYAVVKEDAGYMIAFCDRNGIAKSIAQWFSEDVKNEIVAKIKAEQNMQEYFGKLSLPI
ncbi:MAG: hypothetical protein QXX64_02755 [Nitrososphaera sp.]|uniref:Uncharacterized protein n=1 Tax=Nitrososphaera gargensis (strain Ga9.2) TaxID=1237085 RepID=K0ILP7_NITGG|nr:hypothetical protein [Candidatus Nitrososphaera gargensis]AFU57204.1 hypothetical protein Ngar_c02560 [Candidatus Nitrososphaera gargensis Ga9.2]